MKAKYGNSWEQEFQSYVSPSRVLEWEEERKRLREAVWALYMSAYWHADRPVDEAKLWTNVRDAAGISPGQTGAILGPDRSESQLSAALQRIEKLQCEMSPLVVLLRAKCSDAEWVEMCKSYAAALRTEAPRNEKG
jgi:predicted DsbA family dithiol-disulfide isomerase